MKLHLGLAAKSAGKVRKHPKRTLAIGLGWIAFGEAATVLYDGETPARTYRKLRNNLCYSRLDAVIATLTDHGRESIRWPWFISMSEFEKRSRG